eukprot:scaffold49438_cov56-Phaeocystis_antarctica.AAC.6
MCGGARASSGSTSCLAGRSTTPRYEGSACTVGAPHLDAKALDVVLDVVGDGWLLGTATAVLPRARRGSVVWVKKDK